MPLKVRDVDSALRKKGFQESGKKNPDHTYYILFYNGKRTGIFTKISHGEKELRDGLCSLMARQIKLTRRQFDEFVDCPLTYDLYVRILVQASELDESEDRPNQKRGSRPKNS